MTAPKVNINLLTEKRLEEKPGGKILKWCLTYGRYIIIATEIIVLFAFFSRFKLDRELTDLNESIKQKKAIVTEAVEFEQEVNKTQEKLTQIKNLEKGRFFYLEVIEYLDKIIPTEVTLDQLLISQKEVSLKGFSLTNRGFTTLLENFRQSEKFTNISIDSLSLGDEGFGLNFNLKAQVVNKS